MKKKLLLTFTLFLGFAGISQISKPIVGAQKSKFEVVKKDKKKEINQKAAGDTLWENDFSIPADWTITTGVGHTNGNWAIVNAMPASLISQIPTYGFPGAMNSSSGGNFALVNSDAAGPGAIQNAILTTSGSIDLSALGATPLMLSFTEIYRHYQESFFVAISNDNGATWTEFQANPPAEVPVNTNSGDPEIEAINITAAIGAGTWGANVKVRFRYSGTYDWFWGVDDVQILEALEDDIKVNRFWVATDMANTQGLDYYKIPLSQTSFPGLTFGANIINNGSSNQPNVALNSSSGAFSATGSSISLAVGASDSVSVTTPFVVPSTIGTSVVNVKTVVPNADDNDANNSGAFNIERTSTVYSRDNDEYSGGFTNFTSNTGLEVKIGNLMEIFDPVNAGYVDVYVANVANTAGKDIDAEVYIFDAASGDFVYYTQTQSHTLTTGDLGGFVSLPFVGSGCILNPGDVILLLAHHYGGSPSVGFGMAQPVQEQTVLGFTSAGSVALADPNAIMIRLDDKNDLGLDDITNNYGLSVYPNPSSDNVQVSFEMKTNANVRISITDVNGKELNSIVLTDVNGTQNVSIDVTNYASGIYLVNLFANDEKVVKKLTVK